MTLAVGAVLGGRGLGFAAPQQRHGGYTADIGILYSLFTFRLPGTIDERVDRATGSYEVSVAGQGARIDNRIESRGKLLGGRWTPLRSTSTFHVAGRESRSETVYDWDRRTVELHSRAETFLLRRTRTVDDTVSIPPGQHVDDAVSALLNYADGHWPVGPDGQLRTSILRRRRAESEGPDEAEGRYGAELVPFVLTLSTDPSGRAEARLDMTRFSSWARANSPARIVFGPNRRPTLISSSLILGTSITIQFTDA